MLRRLHHIFVLLALAQSAGGAVADDDPAAIEAARAARGVFKTYCHRCHGIEFKVDDLHILKAQSIIDAGYVEPGDVDGSHLWQLVSVDKKMPPPGNPRPSPSELSAIGRWIELDCAPFPVEKPREPITVDRMLELIQADLRGARREDRQFLRYITLVNLHNNSFETRVRTSSVNVEEGDLRLMRAAVSKLVNSVSWERQIAVPQPVDDAQSVLRIDLRDYGWDAFDAWGALLRVYPYALSFETHLDDARRERFQEVRELAGHDMPFLRADWFVATASRPPLYTALLQLPDDVVSLERRLAVDPEQDFLDDRLARAGFAASGVSQSNRLVDRHATRLGYYWKSYDFARSEGEGNLFRFPLGPQFADNPFSQLAFRHDGGEMIFSLPNSLQAYYLADAKGNKLDEGPVEVVRDPNETSGSPKVVNGISCMGCHKHGMIRFEDTVREGLAVDGRARLKVKELFPDADAMDRLLDQDEAQFLRAAEAATAPFLRVDRNDTRAFQEFLEPIQASVRGYYGDLGLEEVAVELGRTPEELAILLKSVRSLRELGLAPLAQGATIKRSTWESLDEFLSLFHRAAIEADEGTPFRKL